MLIVGNGEPRYLLVQLVNIHEAIVNLQGKFPLSSPVSLLQFHSADETFCPLDEHQVGLGDFPTK